jgi:hypothetical protein
MTPKVCELPGCGEVIPPEADSGSPRKYCCSQHRVEAQRIRRQVRRGLADDEKDQTQRIQTLLEPAQVAGPSTAARRDKGLMVEGAKGQPPGPKSTKRPAKRSKVRSGAAPTAGNGNVGRRAGSAKSGRARAAVAVLSVAALVGGMASGDISVPLPRNGLGAKPTTRLPGQTSASAAGQVSTTWVPKTRQKLADIDGLLVRILHAENAAENAPRTIQTVDLRTMTANIANAKAWLEQWQRTLRADLTAAATYEQAIRDRQFVLSQLSWVMRALWSLDNLTGDARLRTEEARRGVNDQAVHLGRRLQKLQQIETQVRPAVLAAGERKLPNLPSWIKNMIDRILRLAQPRPDLLAGPPLAPLQASARGGVSTSAPPKPSSRSSAEESSSEPSTSTSQPPATGQTTPSDSGATEQRGSSSGDGGGDASPSDSGGDAGPVADTASSDTASSDTEDSPADSGTTSFSGENESDDADDTATTADPVETDTDDTDDAADIDAADADDTDAGNADVAGDPDSGEGLGGASSADPSGGIDTDEGGAEVGAADDGTSDSDAASDSGSASDSGTGDGGDAGDGDGGAGF